MARVSRFYLAFSQTGRRPVRLPRPGRVRQFSLSIADFAHYFAILGLIDSVRAPVYARGPMRLTIRTDLLRSFCRCWRLAGAGPAVPRAAGAAAGRPANPDRPGHAARPVSATGAPIRRRPGGRRSASRWPSRRRRSDNPPNRRTAANAVYLFISTRPDGEGEQRGFGPGHRLCVQAEHRGQRRRRRRELRHVHPERRRLGQERGRRGAS